MCIENPMIRPIQESTPIAECACGCKCEIFAWEDRIEFDGEIYVNAEHLAKGIGAFKIYG